MWKSIKIHTWWLNEDISQFKFLTVIFKNFVWKKHIRYSICVNIHSCLFVCYVDLVYICECTSKHIHSSCLFVGFIVQLKNLSVIWRLKLSRDCHYFLCVFNSFCWSPGIIISHVLSWYQLKTMLLFWVGFFFFFKLI